MKSRKVSVRYSSLKEKPITIHASAFDSLCLNSSNILFSNSFTCMCFGAKLHQAQIVVKDDFHRAGAWTGTLASNIDEKEGPQNRTYSHRVQ
jgi:hypothetical protein